MAWSAPPTVATGDLFTAAMWNTYIRDNPNHLRVMTGGADPTTQYHVLQVAGTLNPFWGLIPDNSLASQKIPKIAISVASFAAAAALGVSGTFYVAGAPDGPLLTYNWQLLQVASITTPTQYLWQMAYLEVDSSQLYIRQIIGGVASAWFKLWNSNNDGSGSGLDADLHDGLNSGNSSGNIPVSNGTVNTNLNADKHDGFDAANTTGQVPVSNGTVNVNLNADKHDGFDAGNATGQVPVSNGTVNTNLNADMTDTHHANDITPLNARVWFATVAQLTAAGAHWSRDDTARGRLLVSADEGGTILGFDLQPNTDYGSDWYPTNGLTFSNTLGVSAGTLDVNPGGNTDSNTNTVTNTAQSGAGVNVPVAHYHTYSANTSITGSPALTGSISLTGIGALWFPPIRGVIWGKKS